MRKSAHGWLSNAASLLLCGLMAGVVVAAAAFPAVATSGLAAKAGADTFDSLPTDFDVLPLPQNSNIYAADGKTLLATMFDENRRNIGIAEIPKVMQDAIVAAEDTRFYKHRGVDVKGAMRALVANQSGAAEQGASTLTMQLVRQLISYSARTPQQVVDATEHSPARKVREMKYAIALEKKLSKEQILERYLNIAPYGHGAYGIFAAAHVYFNKDPKDLTLDEAALIAGLVKAPGTNDPTTEKGLPRSVDRMKYVLRQMASMGTITKTQLAEAEKVDIGKKIVGKRTPQGCESIERPELNAGFFCDYLRRWWLTQPAFGADGFERENRLHSGGYTIISSLDIAAQTAAAKYVVDQPDVGTNEKIKLGDPRALMLAGVEPGTGRVQILATNRIFSNNQTNNGANTNPDKKHLKGNYPSTTVPIITGDVGIPGYQAGSAFKLFTAIAGLEAGYPLMFTIDVESPFRSNFYGSPGESTTCDGNKYCPKNAADQTGPYNMWTGFGKSINTYFVPLEQMVGADKVVDVAKRMGIEFRQPEEAELAANAKGWGSFTLGVSSTTPLQLANAYATIAADGTFCEPIPVVEIRGQDGKKNDAGNPRCKNVIDPEVARAAVDMARCPVGDQSATNQCGGAGTADYVRRVVKRQVAGKSGTTDSQRSVTITVMTKQLSISVFLTDPDWPQTNKNMTHPQPNYAAAYTLRDALAGKPNVKFVPPTRDRQFGRMSPIPDVGACAAVNTARSKVRGAGFTVTVASDQIASNCPPGTVAKVSPSGSTVKGGPVMLYVSKGPGNPTPRNSG
jgi:membrane peptidoglycan carboxypeptidase